MVGDNDGRKATKVHMTINDHQILMGYLEDDGNYEQLFGSGRKTSIGGKHVTKKQA